MKEIVKSALVTFACGAASAFGMLTGFAAFEAMSNPDKRAKVKQRFTDIKNAVVGKEGR